MIKQIIKRLLQNKEAKTLASNFTYLLLLQIAGYIFPLITMPYLARVLGVDGFGKIAFATGIIVCVQTITDWGLNFSATRDLARCRDDKEKVSEIFSNVIWSKCLLMVLAFMLLVVSIFTIPFLKENSNIILFTFLLIPGHIMFPDWFFQAMEKMKYITYLNILSKFLFTLLVFVFIKEEKDFVLQPIIVAMGFFVSGIIAMYYILSKWDVKLQKPDIKKIRKTISDSTDIFINNLMPNLYNNFSVVLLGFFGGVSANGLLDAGSKFSNIGQQFMSVFSQTFYPFLSRRIEKHNLYGKINIWTSIFISLFLYLAAPLLIKLFLSEEFVGSVIILQIISLSIIFLSFINVYGTNYLIITGYERELRNITIISSIIGFIIAFPLIYYFDYVGAAVTITFTRALLGVSTMVYALKLKKSLCETIY